jgi:hypothetical protein
MLKRNLNEFESRPECRPGSGLDRLLPVHPFDVISYMVKEYRIP